MSEWLKEHDWKSCVSSNRDPGFKSRLLRHFCPPAGGLTGCKRRGARVVEWGGLENRFRRLANVGSNPTLSASLPRLHKLEI